nr:hypothetical protein CFP56_33830 [Quercus suber]
MSNFCLVTRASLKFWWQLAPVSFPRSALGEFSVIPQLGSAGASTVGVAVPRSEAKTGGVAEVVAASAGVEVRLEEPLLPLQDPWYCLTSLFPVVRALEVSSLSVPKNWILKREAPSRETAWVLVASDMERICLLPSMGDVNLLELGLSDEEFTIVGKLLETFGGTFVSWAVHEAFHISSSRSIKQRCVLAFRLKVWNLPSITLLDDGAHFVWKCNSYVAAGFCCPNPFPSARPESQEFGLVDHEKIPNFLLTTSPSYISYPSGVEFDLTQYNPHRVLRKFGFDQDVSDINAIGCPLSDAMKPLVHSTTLEYWASKVERVLVLSRHHEGYATSNMKLYWRKVMSSFINYSEKNIIVRALESNLATGAPKRSHGKSPSFEDKPKKVRRRRASAEKPKAGSPKPSAIVQSRSGAAPATKSSVPTAASASTPLPLKQYKRKTSAGPTNKDIEMADEGPTVTAGEIVAGVSSKEHADKDLDVIVSVGEAVTGMPSKEYAGKGLNVIIIAGEAVTSAPNQRHVVSSTVHDVHQRKEPPELRSGSSGVAVKRMNLKEFLEQFAEDEENMKVAADFYPLSSNIVMFQWSEIPTEVKMADLKKEIAAKTVELSFLVSQRDEMMQSSSTGGASSSADTFGNGLLD